MVVQEGYREGTGWRVEVYLQGEREWNKGNTCDDTNTVCGNLWLVFQAILY